MMTKHRMKAKVDDNQEDIVRNLRRIPGVTVAPGHDDVLAGYRGKTYWYEIKNPDAVSKKTGKILESAIKDSQRKLRAEWAGHYRIVSSLDEILRDIGII